MGLDTGDFLRRLREETRAEHAEVERAVPVLREALDVADYRRILARFYGYHTPLEARLETRVAALPASLDWPARRKCPGLRRDLAALGLEGGALAGLPRCAVLPSLSSPARVLGCLYVLEGASLGGQVICRHLAGLDAEIARNRRFFRGYGENTGAMWQSFRRLLVEHAPGPACQDDVIAAARETFQTLAAWMLERPVSLDEC